MLLENIESEKNDEKKSDPDNISSEELKEMIRRLRTTISDPFFSDFEEPYPSMFEID